MMNNAVMVVLCLMIGAFFGMCATIVGLVLIEDIMIKKEKKNEKDS